MARLKAAARNKLAPAKFGLPKQREYPMPDKGHAADAKARASEAVDKGSMSRSTEAKIDTKANHVLGEKSSAPRSGARDGLGHGKGGLAVHPSARQVNIHSDRMMRDERY